MPNTALRVTKALLLFLIGFSTQARGAPVDSGPVREGMERLIAYLDSALYRDIATWEEHLVLTYRKVQGRAPGLRDAAILTLLHRDIALPRSAVLSHALRGNRPKPSWEQCRALIPRFHPEDLVPDPATQREANRLKSAIKGKLRTLLGEADHLGTARKSSTIPVIETESQPFEEYQVYFGYLHAHSALSDGEGDPLDAYAFARDQGQLDFFALTDHGEMLALWPWQDKWAQLVDAAEANYEPGTFVSLWGFEWSNPLLGHMNVFNSAEFTGALETFRLLEMYDWIVDRPETFAQFNHPGDYDLLGIEFLHLLGYPPVREQVVGIETWNGDYSFDDYFYGGGYNTGPSYLDEANRRGWRLGALGSQDNHQQDWGVKNDFRTAVLARNLTREEIIEAYRNRRFYATEDKDLMLDLRSQGYPMGSRLTGMARSFEVHACDGSGDSFEEIRFYRNGQLRETQPVSGTCVDATFTDLSFLSDSYYVIVRQSDDNDSNGRPDEAISSPIWYSAR